MTDGRARVGERGWANEDGRARIGGRGRKLALASFILVTLALALALAFLVALVHLSSVALPRSLFLSLGRNGMDKGGQGEGLRASSGRESEERVVDYDEQPGGKAGTRNRWTSDEPAGERGGRSGEGGCADGQEEDRRASEERTRDVIQCAPAASTPPPPPAPAQMGLKNPNIFLLIFPTFSAPEIPARRNNLDPRPALAALHSEHTPLPSLPAPPAG
ncbi:hypothetical protein BDN70DRAFT_998945 [Pholiota conissans]|uniref:Uncharacterized protein n=1 Tax=Pholiota conissans TaxID=109636 RepID=A0A9P5YK54_9AGAR|nr:hypothetical protein BDN70DRAFT_998945 [Pholiota conissans]